MSGTSEPNNDHLRNRWRERRLSRFLQAVDEVAQSQAPVRILDIGGTIGYWTALEDLWRGRNIEVTMVNLAAEPVDRPGFTSLAGDACALPFDDHAFDIVHSNSVIEHVGRWNNMRRMANEVRRLAPRYFVQTPNFGFPIEPHYRFPMIHWLPEQVRLSIIRRRGCGFYPRAQSMDEGMRYVEDAILLTYGQMAELFPDARIEREKVALMTKSLIAIR
jgi:hypothetical protein